MDDYQKMRPKKPLHYNPSNYYIKTVKGVETELSTEQVLAEWGQVFLNELDAGEIIEMSYYTIERANGAKK